MIEGSANLTFRNTVDASLALGTVSAGLVDSLYNYALSKGGNPDQLVNSSGLNLGILDDPDNRVSLAVYIALFRAAKIQCDDPALALRFASDRKLADISVVGLLSRASETMMDSLVQLNRYGELVTELDLGTSQKRFDYQIIKNEAWIVDTRQNPNTMPELTETAFTRLITVPRSFLPRPHILEAHVTHDRPKYGHVYEQIWQCPITFGARQNALKFDKVMQYHRVQQEPKFAFGMLSKHASELLEDLRAFKTTRGRVERHLLPILHKGSITVETTAKNFGFSRQTLYRLLKAEGTTFEQVLDTLRHQLSMYYLSEKKVSVNETAYLLGFSDPASFSRAFKRWTGFNPRDAGKVTLTTF